MMTTHIKSDLSLLDVANLRIGFKNASGVAEAVRGVSFSMQRETLAIVGESGSGKSVLVRSLLGLLPAPAVVSADHALFEGEELLALSPTGMRAVRGRRIGMVLQDPHHALNPVRSVGSQIAEMARYTRGLSRKAARSLSFDLLADVRISSPAEVADLYPHQISGGMGQRVMIAMALAGEPDLLIADEATSALDAVVQHHVLDLLRDQIERRQMGLILISHDLDLVARHADRVLVMYGGRVVEELDADNLSGARHDYTRGLLACRPTLENIGTDLPILRRSSSWTV